MLKKFFEWLYNFDEPWYKIYKIRGINHFQLNNGMHVWPVWDKVRVIMLYRRFKFWAFGTEIKPYERYGKYKDMGGM